MVGGLLLGQALASHPATHAAAASGGAASDLRAEAPAAKAAAAAPVAPPPAPAETAAPLVVTDEGATAVTVRAPRPAHHGVKKTPKAAAAHETNDESRKTSAPAGGDSNK
jgi:hypothetical protein